MCNFKYRYRETPDPRRIDPESLSRAARKGIRGKERRAKTARRKLAANKLDRTQ